MGQIAGNTTNDLTLQQRLALRIEQLNVLSQVYGLLHAEVAQTHSLIAALHLQLGDTAAAIREQRCAVIVSERSLGTDHSVTASHYV